MEGCVLGYDPPGLSRQQLSSQVRATSNRNCIVLPGRNHLAADLRDLWTQPFGVNRCGAAVDVAGRRVTRGECNPSIKKHVDLAMQGSSSLSRLHHFGTRARPARRLPFLRSLYVASNIGNFPKTHRTPEPSARLNPRKIVLFRRDSALWPPRDVSVEPI